MCQCPVCESRGGIHIAAMLEVVTWARLRGSLGSGKEILDTASAVRETRGRLRNGSTHYGFDPLAGQDKTGLQEYKSTDFP